MHDLRRATTGQTSVQRGTRAGGAAENRKGEYPATAPQPLGVWMGRLAGNNAEAAMSGCRQRRTAQRGPRTLKGQGTSREASGGTCC